MTINDNNLERAKFFFKEGLNYFENKKYKESEINFLESLKLIPDRISTIQNLINTYIVSDQNIKLKKLLEKYIHLKSKKEIQYGIAYDYFFDKNFSESIYICEKLIQDQEYQLSMMDLLASNFKKQKKFLEALKVYKKQLKEQKNYSIYYKIGVLFFDLGRVHKAYLYFLKSKNYKKDDDANLWNLSLCYLTKGNLELGFSLYEYRWKKKDFPKIKFQEIKSPKTIKDVKNKKILISDEQGLGDTIQFSRFVIDLLNYTKKITFVVNSKLAKLLSSLDKNIKVVDYESLKLDNFDYHISLCSLPKFLNINHKNNIKYKQLDITDEKKIEIKKNKINIGIAWSGNPDFPLDEYRSIRFNNLISLFNIKDVNFFKLSQNVRIEEFKDYNLLNNLFDLGNENLFNIAQVMKQLDIVVSSDTSIIHLAGILNIKSILLLNFNSDWRWFNDSKKTIWYPSVSIIKQEKFDSWENVFIELKNRIEKIPKKLHSHKGT